MRRARGPRSSCSRLSWFGAYYIRSKMGYIYEWTDGRLGSPKTVKVEQTVPVGRTGS